MKSQQATNKAQISTSITITQVDVSLIKPYGKNPKLHTDEQIDVIYRSMQVAGYNQPIVLDEDNVIICGHGRFMCIKKHMPILTEIDCIILPNLTESQKREARILDNSSNQMTGFIAELLKEELTLLRQDNIQIENLGIDNVIQLLQQDFDLECNNNKYNQQSNNIPPKYPSISKQGDIWQLGKHKIAHGNCLDANFVSRLFDGKLAKAIFTDPPYNLCMNTISSSNSPAERVDFAMAKGEMSEEEFTEFLTKYMQICHDYSADVSTHYHFMDWRHAVEIITAIKAVYGNQGYAARMTWCKDLSKPFPSPTYSNDSEDLHVARKGKEATRHIKSNLLHYPCASSFANEDNKRDAETNVSKGNERLAIHPTPKPTALVANVITDFTQEGDIVFDPFIGSGATLLACQRTGRVCYGVDIEGKYINYILHAYERDIGVKPVKLNYKEGEVCGA